MDLKKCKWTSLCTWYVIFALFTHIFDILKTVKILQIFSQWVIFSRKFLRIFLGNRFTCMGEEIKLQELNEIYLLVCTCFQKIFVTKGQKPVKHPCDYHQSPLLKDQRKKKPRVFFQSITKWGRVPCNGENSAVLVQFGKSSKEYELDKLRKFTLNQHYIQTFISLTTLPLIFSFGMCALHIQFLYIKFSLWQSAANWEFWALLGKKYYLALGLGPYNGPKLTRKKSLKYTWAP